VRRLPGPERSAALESLAPLLSAGKRPNHYSTVFHPTKPDGVLNFIGRFKSAALTLKPEKGLVGDNANKGEITLHNISSN